MVEKEGSPRKLLLDEQDESSKKLSPISQSSVQDSESADKIEQLANLRNAECRLVQIILVFNRLGRVHSLSYVGLSWSTLNGLE